MAIDYSVFNDVPGAFPKSRVKALDKHDADAKVKTTDKKENAKAKARAEGQCEVRIVLSSVGRKSQATRCDGIDRQTHHLLGGIGRRNKGKSILADYKLRVCDTCHAAITANILKPTTAVHDAYTVLYWREK